MKEIRFIHTADLHLDSPFLGLSHLPKEIFTRIQESTFTAFEKVINAAIERKVDFVVIVGDLFDGEDRSIKAQARLRRQLDRLGEAEITAFISHGNHDHLGGNWLKFEMPDHVHIFNENVEMIPFVAKNGSKVHLYGFSYPERHVTERKILEYQNIPGADFQIGMLHGHCEGGSASHQPYAPFSITELLDKKLDYWALGHIHKTQLLHVDPHIVYPGNIQGRHRKEQGSKGCYEVNLTANGSTEIEFIESTDVYWKSLQIDAVDNISLTNLFNSCSNMMDLLAAGNGQGVLLEITINNPESISNDLKQKIENGEFLEMLQDGVQTSEEFVWPYKITMSAESEKIKDDLHGAAFLHVLEQTKNEFHESTAFEATIQELYSHVYGSRYLDQIDEDEKQELIDAAGVIALNQLGR